ncbi:ZIP zinc transporter-domain-containing protein [Glomus cerebriforme]|uniref:ZIP zinc transporter-domain-containing protein n=1 Tax=Glomus cerebriforme TaxID=658196 RepID=A0A397T0Y0_9GLOM|nr:ZIP zinc transporter-domain-containing protein [Glomus cerebriforme]
MKFSFTNNFHFIFKYFLVMSFINKINLVFYAWKFLVLSIIITKIHAHGGINEGTSTPIKAPSVFANEKHSTLAEGNVGLAFGLTLMASLASALGSFTPFLDKLFPYIPFLAHIKITESKGFLAGALSFSSGILLSLTLGDLFPEATTSFNNSKLFNRKYSSLVAASIFIFTSLLIMISKFLIKKYKKKKNINGQIIYGENLKENFNQDESKGSDSTDIKIENDSAVSQKKELVDSKNAKRFKNMGIQVAVALAFHNFPEGLASFTTTLGSERVGVIFAIALSLHKIPEGLIISLPIYYSTGSRWKAFAIAASVGIISQMLGGVLGYVLFVTIWNDAISGVIFSIVTAALLYAILHGMLPMAHHYDPKDKYVTNYTFAGLIFFAIVSSLFNLAGTD